VVLTSLATQARAAGRGTLRPDGAGGTKDDSGSSAKTDDSNVHDRVASPAFSGQMAHLRWSAAGSVKAALHPEGVALTGSAARRHSPLLAGKCFLAVGAADRSHVTPTINGASRAMSPKDEGSLRSAAIPGAAVSCLWQRAKPVASLSPLGGDG